MHKQNIFEQVRKDCSLLDYLKAETDCQIKHVGEKTYRVEPCIFCQHFDCMTVYTETQSYNCFSCGAAGDVIHIAKHLKGLNRNMDAARSIMSRMKINPRENNKAVSKKININSAKEDDVTNDEGRLSELRELIARYYHNQLLNNKEALDYQIKTRGHSLKILKSLIVGFAHGDVIAHAENNNFSIKELLNIGIIKRTGSGFKPTIAPGMYVYPHRVNGLISYFTIKDPSKNRKYQIPKKHAASNWVCLGQDCILEDGPVYIVEGEDDIISVMDKAKQKNVICTNGNYNTGNILSFIEENAKGKTFYLCFDRDDSGQNYAVKYAESITTGGGTAKIIDIPAPHNDVDEYLQAAKDPIIAFQELMKTAREVYKQNINQKNDPLDSYEFNSFSVIGELEDERIVFWSKVNRKIYKVTLRDLQLDKLVQIGGNEVASRVSKNEQDGKIYFRTLKKKLIISASKKQLGNLEGFGQGIHLLTDGNLLIVNGSDAYSFDGKTFKTQTYPLIDGKLVEWRPGSAWIDFNAVQSRIRQMTKEDANNVMEDFLDLFAQWGFTGTMDFWLITGWVFAQTLQSLWSWRSHMWLSGSQSSGKTLMTLLLEMLGGNLALRCEGQTLSEPGLRQSIKNDSVLVSIDEFEKTESRERIIEYLRSAGRGGLVLKGSSSQQAIRFSIRHSVFVCSIETGLKRAAENSRFLIIETKKDPRKNPRLPDASEIQKLRTNLFSYSLWAASKAKKLIDNLKQIAGFDPRFLESVAIPFAMLAVCFENPEATLNDLLDNYLDEWKLRQEGVVEDESKLFEDIMSANTRVTETQESPTDGNRTIYVTRAVSQVINNMSIYPEYKATLEARGLKVLENGYFLHPGMVAQNLLQKTRWKDLNIRNILLRIPGAHAVRDRLADSLKRGIFIPKDFESLGEDLG